MERSPQNLVEIGQVITGYPAHHFARILRCAPGSRLKTGAQGGSARMTASFKVFVLAVTHASWHLAVVGPPRAPPPGRSLHCGLPPALTRSAPFRFSPRLRWPSVRLNPAPRIIVPIPSRHFGGSLIHRGASRLRPFPPPTPVAVEPPRVRPRLTLDLSCCNRNRPVGQHGALVGRNGNDKE